MLTNKERIRNELTDVGAVLDILKDELDINFDDYDQYRTHMSNEVAKSIIRKKKYYEVSKGLGMIKD